MSRKRSGRVQKRRALGIGWAVTLLAFARLIESADQNEDGFLRVCVLAALVGCFYLLGELLDIEHTRVRRSGRWTGDGKTNVRGASKMGPDAARLEISDANAERCASLSSNRSKGAPE